MTKKNLMPAFIRHPDTSKMVAINTLAADDVMSVLSGAQMEEIAARYPEHKASQAAAHDASRNSVVAAAVASDPECQGKADVALQLLADENLRELSGAGLVSIIRAAAASAANNAAAEEARQRAYMLELLGRNQNSTISANGDDGHAPADAVASTWKKATTEANARYGL